jgi:hypothetical protein
MARETNFALRIIFVQTSKSSLTRRKVFRQRADGFSSPPKEGVLRILIALKNLPSSAGFEPANLGLNESTLVTRPGFEINVTQQEATAL